MRLVRRDQMKLEGRSLMSKAALILRACSAEWRSSKRGREVERARLERDAAAAIGPLNLESWSPPASSS